MPENIDLLIEARWVAPVEPDTLLHHYSIAIRGERIVALLPAAEALDRFEPRQHIRLSDHIVIPGLINLHTHAAMTLLRGYADDLPLMEWLQTRIWPAEAAHVSPQFVRDGTRLACAEMLKGGITCFNDMYFHPEAAAEAATEFGMRAVLGITAIEFPTAYASDADDYIAKGLAARDQWIDHPLLSFCLAPHAPYTVSDATFERILTLSEQLDLPIHCHIHETLAEIDESLNQQGTRPAARLERLGLLGPGFIGVHAVHLEIEEMDLLARQGCSIAHCPSSNLKLGSGIAPVAELLKRGINVGLGTDGAASNNRLDLFQEMRLAALLAKGSTGDASALPAHQALRMATLNGAAALGLDQEVGSIKPGKLADLCAVELSSLDVSPCFDPISHLVYSSGREHISHVWVAGKCCVERGELTFTGQNDLKNSVSLWQNKVDSR
ncbi:MAG TPA: TRZ/ATZ family hydrolase [Rhodocyclaceae bacterium]|nr:TRZ/ATZ family hydrolase [Rhodocyclaceae bacterium]